MRRTPLPLLVVLALFVPRSVSVDFHFPNPVFDSLQSAAAMTGGDFNGDGIGDLAVAGAGASVAMLLGRGDGSFHPPRVATGPPGAAGAIATADFNGDGNQDLVTASAVGSQVVVFPGLGDGGFAAPVVSGAGTYPIALAAGEFNGDGRPDLAVVDNESYGPGTVWILSGNGDGTFVAPVGTGLSDEPIALVATDFNGDGSDDLAVAVSTGANDGIRILLNNGRGTFALASFLPTGTYPAALARGDVNDDGRLDLAAANRGSSDASIFLGNGDGTFTAAPRAALGERPAEIAMADFTADGRLDLVAPVYSGEILVLPGQGDGTFAAPLRSLSGSDPTAAVVGDFDRDGKQDVAVSTYFEGTIWLHLGRGDGTFPSGARFPAATVPQSLALGDFEADGRDDLAVVGSIYSCGSGICSSPGELALIRGSGDGAFGSPAVLAVGDFPAAIAKGDFNRDGREDLAIANGGPIQCAYFSCSSLQGSVSVLLGRGDATFAPETHFAAGAGGDAIVVADFNGDDSEDLAVANFDSCDVSILIGRGDGTFGPASSHPAGCHPTALAVGDFNADGRKDLVVADLYSGVVPFRPADTAVVPDLSGFNGAVIFRGNGDGSFAPGGLLDTGPYPSSVAAGDLNGDGRDDVVVGVFDLFVYLSNADGSFTLVRRPLARSGSRTVAIGDLNGDGRADLAVADENADKITVLVGSGDGTFPSAASFGTGRSPRAVVIADLNRDGHRDLLTADDAGGGITVLMNQAAPSANDVDGDGIPDAQDNCPTTPNSDQREGDADGVGDVCDCAPADAGAFAVPGEISGVALDGDTLMWNSAAPWAGSATGYDIVRGRLHELPLGSGPSVVCLEQGTPSLSTTDTSSPPLGEAHWYLIRGRNVCGAGSYGSTSDGTETILNACP